MTQIGDRQDVEILSLLDNKSLHIYEKRNHMLQIARGSHITFLDDDDDISDTYVSRLTEEIDNTPEADVISFNQVCWLEGRRCRVFAKMGNPHNHCIINPQNPREYMDTLRPPYHWCCWKRSLCLTETFRSAYADGDSGQSEEDIDWLLRLYPKVKKSVYLENDWLHIYRWSPEASESVL